MISSILLIISILTGQLIKFPVFASSGPTILDTTVFILCLLGIFQIKFKFKKPNFVYFSGLLFVIIAILSLILTPLHLKINEYLISFSYTFRFFMYILLGWLLYSGALQKLKEKISVNLLISGTLLGILGIMQFIFLPDLRFLQKLGGDPHFYRTASTFLDPNFAGAYFVLTLILLVNRYKTFKLKLNKPNILYFLVYLALLTTFSRSCYLMFLVSFLTYSLLKKSLKTAVVTIILFVILLGSFQIYIRSVNLVTPLDRNQTASFRLSTWQQGFKIFSQNPILGVGFNAYNFALREYKLGDEQFLTGHGATTNDSSLLYILSTTGIFGFTVFLLFIAGIIKSKKIPLISATSGLLINSFFINSLFYPFILIWIILTISNHDE